MLRGLSFLLPVLLGGCLDLSGPCENSIVGRLPDPSGTKQAVLFERSCGATTGFTTQISILPIGADPQDAGNIFRADEGDAPAVWGGPWAQAKWLSPDRLQIVFDDSARLFAAFKQHGGVEIEYRRSGRPPR